MFCLVFIFNRIGPRCAFQWVALVSLHLPSAGVIFTSLSSSGKHHFCPPHLYITVLSLTKPSSLSQVPLRQFFRDRLCQCFPNLRNEQSPL